MTALPRMYRDLAQWWPLISPPSHYEEEAADLLSRLPTRRPATLLELGAGGGSLAFHLKRHFQMTLTDVAEEMLAVSRQVNPECEHRLGDMRTLRLHRQFDVVLVHDSIMYATEPEDVRATLHTAAIHCRVGGTVAVLPDFVRETFVSGTDHGGEDAPDGRGLRYLEWTWDPDPNDHTYVSEYAFLMRSPDGRVSVAYDRHVEGLFPRNDWLQWFTQAGLNATSSVDPWGREVFLAVRER
jgi:trans-aconitate methyltransferase